MRSHEDLNQGSGGGDGDKLSNSGEIEWTEPQALVNGLPATGAFEAVDKITDLHN